MSLIVAAVSLSGALVAPALSYPRPGTYQLVSATPAGKPGNADSAWGAAAGDRPGMGVAMSPDARFVAFASAASDLVAGDTNNKLTDVFIRDRKTGKTAIVSAPTAGSDPAHLGATGLPGCAGASHPAVSSNGRYVAFDSCAINLLGIGKDTNLTNDVFVHDTKTDTTTRVSVASDGTESDPFGPSYAPSMSADGRYVVFESAATNFGGVCPPGPDQSTCETTDRVGTFKTQIFVHDMQARTTRLVSATPSGVVANGASFDAAISPDGRYVGFVTYATNLASNDVNLSPTNPYAVPSSPDVYLKDLKTGSVRLISAGVSGRAATGATPESGTRFSGGVVGAVAISANDRYVAFGSSGSDLVPDGAGGGIFVRDLARNQTQRVSVSSAGQTFDGTELSGGCGVGHDVAINADGRYVGFVCDPDPTCPAEYPYVAVYDRVTGALDRVTMEDTAPGTPNRCTAKNDTREDMKLALSADGRMVAFGTNDPGLIPGGNPSGKPGPFQVLVRDRGRPLGGGAVWTGKSATTGIAGASAAYRPATRDVFVRLQLDSLLALAPANVVGLALTAGGVHYEVRVSRGLLLPDFGLYRAVEGGGWQRVRTLVGGLGTTGNEAVVAVPIAALGLPNGAQLRDLDAFTAGPGTAGPGTAGPGTAGLYRLESLPLAPSQF